MRKNAKYFVQAFDFPDGFILSDNYEIVRKIGGGWEGEVYIIRESRTGIERAAKFFLPHRNVNNRAANFYAKKLHKLRNCKMLIRYINQEVMDYFGWEVTYLVSEYVDGRSLSDFIHQQKGKRLTAFQAIHLLHALSKGMEELHAQKEYHGDLHSENIIVQRFGLGFDLKLIDMYHWGSGSAENIRDDVVNLVHLFYEALGGQKYYSNQPQAVKDICCGLKQSLILKKFKTAGQLRYYLENISWS